MPINKFSNAFNFSFPGSPEPVGQADTAAGCVCSEGAVNNQNGCSRIGKSLKPPGSSECRGVWLWWRPPCREKGSVACRMSWDRELRQAGCLRPLLELIRKPLKQTKFPETEKVPFECAQKEEA